MSEIVMLANRIREKIADIPVSGGCARHLHTQEAER